MEQWKCCSQFQHQYRCVIIGGVISRKNYPPNTEEPNENIILIKTNKKMPFVIVFFLHNFSSFFDSIRSNNILSLSILSPLHTSIFLPWMRKNWCTHTHFPSSFHNHNQVLYTFRWIRNGTESESERRVRSQIRWFCCWFLSASLILLTRCSKIQKTCPYPEVFISLTHAQHTFIMIFS